jgi:adenylyltransferase/sulfurtransferase
MSNSDFFARQTLVLGEEVGDVIRNTRILVIGVGAGGNELLKNLILMGFGNFTLVDFDPIENTNLSRTTLFTKKDIGKSKALVAAERLTEMCLHDSPNIVGLDVKIQDIGRQIFINHDLVVCCVDTKNARVYINDWCVRLKKPFFEMGFEKFVVQISFFPNQSISDPCLRDFIGNTPISGRRQSCSKLKMFDTQLQHIPTIQVAAALAGVFIATEIILFLKGESRLNNKMMQYAAQYHRVLEIDIEQSDQCSAHNSHELPIYSSKLNYTNTFKELFEELKNEQNLECYISWPEEFIYQVECEKCKKEILIKKFKSEVFDHERWCSDCRWAYTEDHPVTSKWSINKSLFLTNEKHTFFLNLPMSEFGVVNEDIIELFVLNDEIQKVLVLI